MPFFIGAPDYASIRHFNSTGNSRFPYDGASGLSDGLGRLTQDQGLHKKILDTDLLGCLSGYLLAETHANDDRDIRSDAYYLSNQIHTGYTSMVWSAKTR